MVVIVQVRVESGLDFQPLRKHSVRTVFRSSLSKQPVMKYISTHKEIHQQRKTVQTSPVGLTYISSRKHELKQLGKRESLSLAQCQLKGFTVEAAISVVQRLREVDRWPWAQRTLPAAVLCGVWIGLQVSPQILSLAEIWGAGREGPHLSEPSQYRLREQQFRLPSDLFHFPYPTQALAKRLSLMKLHRLHNP